MNLSFKTQISLEIKVFRMFFFDVYRSTVWYTDVLVQPVILSSVKE